MAKERARISLREAAKKALRSVWPSKLERLKRELRDCERVLDLGCRNGSPLQHLCLSYSVGVDRFRPYLEESKQAGIHSEYILADLRRLEFKARAFDAVLALEVLEHLTKEEGYLLLQKIERWAAKKVVVSTPNGYLWQDGYDDNPAQAHKSAWRVSDLKERGFAVHGVGGWKRLHGYKATVRFRPRLLWSLISELTSIPTYYWLPESAFGLWAVKRPVAAKGGLHEEARTDP